MTTPDPNNHRNPNAVENRFAGLYPDNSYPLVDGQLDFEQEKRLQARQETDWARGTRPDHPPFTEKGPDATLAESLLEGSSAPVAPVVPTVSATPNWYDGVSAAPSVISGTYMMYDGPAIPKADVIDLFITAQGDNYPPPETVSYTVYIVPYEVDGLSEFPPVHYGYTFRSGSPEFPQGQWLGLGAGDVGYEGNPAAITSMEYTLIQFFEAGVTPLEISLPDGFAYYGTGTAVLPEPPVITTLGTPDWFTPSGGGNVYDAYYCTYAGDVLSANSAKIAWAAAQTNPDGSPTLLEHYLHLGHIPNGDSLGSADFVATWDLANTDWTGAEAGLPGSLSPGDWTIVTVRSAAEPNKASLLSGLTHNV